MFEKLSVQHSLTTVWLSANALVLISVVALRCVRLVLGWVTGGHLRVGKTSQCVTSHHGHLLLPISVSRRNED